MIFFVWKLAHHGFPRVWFVELALVIFVSLAAGAASWYGLERRVLGAVGKPRQAASPADDVPPALLQTTGA